MVEELSGDEDSLAPFQGANAIPCPLGMDIEFLEPHIRARYQEKLSLLGEAEA